MLHLHTDFANAVGNSLDTAVIQISGPVEHSALDPFFQQRLPHDLAQTFGLGDVAEGLFPLGSGVLAICCHIHKRQASLVRLGHVIHHGHIEVFQGFMDTDPGSLGSPYNPFSDSPMPDFSPKFF